MLGQAAQATISYLKLPQGNSCFPDDADWKIAKHYRRHEWACLAHECKQLRERAMKSRTVGQDNWSETTGDSNL